MRHFQLSLIALLVLILAVVPLVGCVSASEYETLQIENTNLKTELEAVKSDLAYAKANSETLRNDYNTLKAQYDRLQADHAVLEATYEKLQAKYDALEATSKPTTTPTIPTPTPMPLPTSGTSEGLSNAKYLFDNSASIISSNGQPVFLGRISNKYDNDSILNRYGSYGLKYSSNSIWNKYGDYGGKYSSYSPFNRYTSSPPKIYIGDTFWGYLSTNKYLSINTLDPNDLLMFAYLKYNDETYLELMIR